MTDSERERFRFLSLLGVALCIGLLVGVAMFVLAEALSCRDSADGACVSEVEFLPQLGNAAFFGFGAAALVLTAGLPFLRARRRARSSAWRAQPGTRP